jgi:3D (Asp-Asp-Asp) domain-containing protein
MRKAKALLYVLVFAAVASLSMPVSSFNIAASDWGFVNVTVVNHHVALEHRTSASTVQRFFREIQMYLGEHDEVSHALDAEPYNGMMIIITRHLAAQVQINGGALAQRILHPSTTVNDVLIALQAEKEVALLYDGDIYRLVEDGEILSFQTWQLREYTEHFSIPYTETFNHTNALWEGKTQVAQWGQAGARTVTTAVVYKGGVPYSRTVLEETHLFDPINRVVNVGTGALGLMTNTSSPDFQYARRLTMQATAYTNSFECTGRRPSDPGYGITANGTRTRRGIVAVDTSVIPLGTRLYVEGYGFALAADRGGSIRGNRIDLWMATRQEALSWGRRTITVFILD